MTSTDIFDKGYSSLNTEQKQAVDTLDGSIMVIAGPGTGKTQLLSLRIANILKNLDINPENILCLTFTESASTNMKKRLQSIIGTSAYKVQIETFHSFGTEIINQYPEYFFGGATFRPIDEIGKVAVLDKIFSNLDLNDPLYSYNPTQGWVYLSAVQQNIKNLKEEGINHTEFEQILKNNKQVLESLNVVVKNNFPEKINKKSQDQIFKFLDCLLDYLEVFLEKRGLESAENNNTLIRHDLAQSLKAELLDLKSELESQEFSSKPFTAWKNRNLVKISEQHYGFKDFENIEKMFSLASIYRKYKEELTFGGFFDFEDMLLEVIKVLESNEFLRLNLQEKYQYIMVDEFQDTSGVQLRLLDNLLTPSTIDFEPNILVVADDDQAVYKFQKASIGNILTFHKKYPQMKFITLTQNYRSTQEILDFAKNVIQNVQIRLTSELNLDKNLVSNVNL